MKHFTDKIDSMLHECFSTKSVKVLVSISAVAIIIGVLFLVVDVMNEHLRKNSAFGKFSKHGKEYVLSQKELVDLLENAVDSSQSVVAQEQARAQSNSQEPQQKSENKKLLGAQPNISEWINNTGTNNAVSLRESEPINNSNQECVYQGHAYSIGGIIKADKGWLRCTPSVIFNADGSSHYGEALWTLRDSVL